jgi:hypothetical protein
LADPDGEEVRVTAGFSAAPEPVLKKREKKDAFSEEKMTNVFT